MGDVCAAPQADGELDGRYSEHSQLLERSICSMDVRAVGLHACAERACSFFSAAAGELEAHEEREAAIDEAAEQRVRGLRKVSVGLRVEGNWGVHWHRAGGSASDLKRQVQNRVKGGLARVCTIVVPDSLSKWSMVKRKTIYSMRDRGLHPSRPRPPSSTLRFRTKRTAACRADGPHKKARNIRCITALQMFDCKEDFRLADEEREEAVKKSTDRVRMAADEEELETSFARAIEFLDEVRSALPKDAARGGRPKRRRPASTATNLHLLDTT